MSLPLEAAARRRVFAIPWHFARVGTALKRLRFLVHLMIGSAIILVGPTSFAQTIGQSHIDSRAVVDQPTTLIEMLRNIDVARKRGLFLREDFYSDTNLKTFFGAMAVERFSYGPERRTAGWITDLGQMIGAKDLGNGRHTQGFSFHFDWRVIDTGLVDASLTMVIGGKPRITFDDVERIFGTHWLAKLTAPPDEVFQPPTQPHGNESIEYEYTSSGIRQLLRIKLESDATVSILSIFAREIR